MDLQNLQHKAQEYQSKLQQLQEQKKELERQSIILNEQLNQYQENILQTFGTADEKELLKLKKLNSKIISKG